MGIKLIKSLKKIKKDPLPLVIGYFGCIQIMHQQLLTKYQLFNVLTFTDLVSKRPHQIYNYKNRLNNLNRFHPKNIYVLDVSSSNLKGIDFIKKVLIPLNPSEILVGEDFKFGSDNCPIKLLKDYFKVSTLNYNKNISTKIIYDLITSNQVEKANDLMSFNLYFESKWVRGLNRGKKIGFPTINLQNEWPFMLKEGSYISFTTIGNKKYKSITFVGKPKTIGKKEKSVVETHIIDRNIRPRLFYPTRVRNHIKVEFLKFIRPNTKFSSIDLLKKDISSDKEIAKKYFRQQNI